MLDTGSDDVNDDLVAFNDATVNTVIHPGDKLKVPPKGNTTTTKKP